jgi:hypothetical protein
MGPPRITHARLPLNRASRCNSLDPIVSTLLALGLAFHYLKTIPLVNITDCPQH